MKRSLVFLAMLAVGLGVTEQASAHDGGDVVAAAVIGAVAGAALASGPGYYEPAPAPVVYSQPAPVVYTQPAPVVYSQPAAQVVSYPAYGGYYAHPVYANYGYGYEHRGWDRNGDHRGWDHRDGDRRGYDHYDNHDGDHRDWH